MAKGTRVRSGKRKEVEQPVVKAYAVQEVATGRKVEEFGTYKEAKEAAQRIRRVQGKEVIVGAVTGHG